MGQSLTFRQTAANLPLDDKAEIIRLEKENYELRQALATLYRWNTDDEVCGDMSVDEAIFEYHKLVDAAGKLLEGGKP
jgi:hypothetical protein